jgi:L-lactate dehydrogenase complex protein LldG
MVGRAGSTARMSAHPSTPAARSLILGRIRDILGKRSEPSEAGYRRIPRDYRDSGILTFEACVALLVDRLQHYQVGVHRCDPPDLPGTIAAALLARGRKHLVVPSDIDRDWLPPAAEFRPDEGLSYSDLNGCGGVLTACSLAIANTGTIVLRHAAGEGRRALTLIPDYHLCVVLADQIVQTVPEAIRRLAALKPALVTTVSGPSATADIEMTRVRGVHGPRTLDVVVVA